MLPKSANTLRSDGYFYLANHRRVRSDDNPLPPEEENWLLCDPDISTLHHDSHPLSSVFLAQPRVRPCQNCLW